MHEPKPYREVHEHLTGRTSSVADRSPSFPQSRRMMNSFLEASIEWPITKVSEHCKLGNHSWWLLFRSLHFHPITIQWIREHIWSTLAPVVVLSHSRESFWMPNAEPMVCCFCSHVAVTILPGGPSSLPENLAENHALHSKRLTSSFQATY